MKVTLLVLAPLIAISAAAQSPRQMMGLGQKAYESGDFETAATNFAGAAAAAKTQKLDPAVAIYNEATADLKGGQASEASKLYEEALHSPDLSLQSRSYFNRGNALMAAADGLEKMQKLDEAKKAVGESISMYENSMALDDKDPDPKTNFELALRKQTEIERKLKQQQQQQQQQDKNDQNKDQNKDQQKQDQGKDQQKQQQDQKQQQPQNQDKEKEKQDADKAASDQKKDQPQEQGKPEKPEDMTKEEASLLLDAAKQQEQADRQQIRLIMGQPQAVEKDW